MPLQELPKMNLSGRVAEVVSTHERLRDAWREFREQALKAYDYVIGDQIDPAIREKLNKANRPALVFNLMQNKIVTIAGLLASNEVFLRAIPANEGDEALADIHTQLVGNWAMRNTNGVKEIAKAAIDAAIGKIGWTNNYWSTLRNPLGEWVTEVFDPFMVMFDRDAKKQDQSDWRYMDVSAFYTLEEIINTYRPYLSPEQIERMWDRDMMLNRVKETGKPLSFFERIWGGVRDFLSGEEGTNRATSDDYSEGVYGHYIDANVGRYRVIEFHDKRYVTRYSAYNTMTRESKDIPMPETDAEMADDLKKQQAEQMIAQLNAQQPVWILQEDFQEELWITAVAPFLLPDEPLCEMPYPVQGKGFSIKPIFCYNFHPDITKTQSLIEVLIDPQDSYNQRRMSFLEWLMDAINPDITAPKGSIDAEDMKSWTSGERGKVKFYRIFGGMRPESDRPMAEGQALKVFSDEDRNLTEVLTQITPNAQGMEESAGESGVLFAQKVQRAMTALSYFFGNVHFHMSEVFKYCDSNLQRFLTMPRMIRILDKTNQPMWLQVNMPTIQGVANDITQGEYDFVPDTKTLGETAKQVKFAEALAFIRTVPPELVKWDELFKLWDSPVAEDMGRFAAAMMGVLNPAAAAAAAGVNPQELAGVASVGGGQAMLLGAQAGAMKGAGQAENTTPPAAGESA